MSAQTKDWQMRRLSAARENGALSCRAHWVAVARGGGADRADNLRVACPPRSLSVGTSPMSHFIALMRA